MVEVILHIEKGKVMKLAFNFKKKEASLEADVEGIVVRGLERKEKDPNRKTRYQIRQEEKRKNLELKHELEQKNFKQGMLMLIGIMVFCVIFGMIATVLGI